MRRIRILIDRVIMRLMRRGLARRERDEENPYNYPLF